LSLSRTSILTLSVGLRRIYANAEHISEAEELPRDVSWN
jgi:hypothetical protein